MSGWIVSSLAGLLAGIAGAMGLGGGSILLLYLTLIAGVGQLVAQGVNLIFFLPCALASAVFSLRAGLIDIRRTLLGMALGVPGAVLGCIAAEWLQGDWLRRLFGVYMLVLGVRELLRRGKQNDPGKC